MGRAKKRLGPEKGEREVVEGEEVKGTRERWRDQRARSGRHYRG